MSEADDVDLVELAISTWEHAPALAHLIILLGEYERWKQCNGGQDAPASHAAGGRAGAPPRYPESHRPINMHFVYSKLRPQIPDGALRSGGFDAWLRDPRLARKHLDSCLLPGPAGLHGGARIAAGRDGVMRYWCDLCLGRGRALGLPDVAASVAVQRVRRLRGVELVIWTARWAIEAGYEDVLKSPLPPFAMLDELRWSPYRQQQAWAAVEGFELLWRCWQLVEPGKRWLLYEPRFVAGWCGFTSGVVTGRRKGKGRGKGTSKASTVRLDYAGTRQAIAAAVEFGLLLRELGNDGKHYHALPEGSDHVGDTCATVEAQEDP